MNLCMSLHFCFVFTEGQAQHPMKHTLAWWAPVEAYHHHLKNALHMRTNHLVAVSAWKMSVRHLMRSQREDVKYADDEQKTLFCDRGKFLELICQFGLNLQVGVWLTTALTHLSTGNFVLFIPFVGWNDAQASSEANETKSVVATLTD